MNEPQWVANSLLRRITCSKKLAASASQSWSVYSGGTECQSFVPLATTTTCGAIDSETTFPGSLSGFSSCEDVNVLSQGAESGKETLNKKQLTICWPAAGRNGDWIYLRGPALQCINRGGVRVNGAVEHSFVAGQLCFILLGRQIRVCVRCIRVPHQACDETAYHF